MDEHPYQEQSSELTQFQNEIAELVRTEKETGTGHFTDLFDVNELTEDDMLLWENYRSHTLTQKEFEVSRELFLRSLPKIDTTMPDAWKKAEAQARQPRYQFWQYIGNMLYEKPQ